MNDQIEYITAYFEGTLSAGERIAFEEHCVADPAFAREVAAYVVMRDTLKTQLYEQKRAEFAVLYKEMTSGMPGANRGMIKKLPFYAVAACLALIVGWLIFFRNPVPRDLATDYIALNFNSLGVTMGSSDRTQLQEGISAFNAKEYRKAVQIFKTLSNDPLMKAEALKNLGITYLVMADYTNAIAQFDALSKMNLYSNPGLFYKAIVLMKRYDGDDREQAVQLLKIVIGKDLSGRKEAEIWLQKL